MSLEYNLAITAVTGGAAGAVITLLIGHFREKKRDRTLRFRVLMQLGYELAQFEGYLQRLIDSNATELELVPFADSMPVSKEAEKIKSMFQYPLMPVELKLRCFDPPLHAKIQDIYRSIETLHLRRVGTSVYKKSDLRKLASDIYEVREALGDAKLELHGYKVRRS